MKGSELLQQLHRRLDIESSRSLAKVLGVTPARVSQLRAKRKLTAREVSGVIVRTRETARVGAISPVVERYPIDKNPTRRSAGFEVFVTTDHPYKLGLKKELEQHHGVYIFYDSVGCALYVGKASKQTLWPEIKSAFNRSRTKQEVMRVQHPTTKHQFRTSD